MSETTALSQASPSAPASSRCAHRTQQGRRCACPFPIPQPDFAAVMPSFSDGISIPMTSSAELLDGDDDLQSPGQVTSFLAALMALLVQGRISVRRAAVLCYAAGQLFRGFRETERQQPRGLLLDLDFAVARRAAGLEPLPSQS